MADEMPGSHRDEDGLDNLEIISLRPRSASGGETLAKPPWFRSRRWQRLTIGLSLLLLVAILLAGQPFIRNPLQGTINAVLFPTPRPTATALPTATPLVPVLATPIAPFTMATALPGVVGVPALDSAPASCGGKSAMQPGDGPPLGSESIGRNPVLLSGFAGPYATLRLGPAAVANAYQWQAPYTRYGWPAPIGLILKSGFAGPVTLTGSDPRTGHPLWFGLITAGVWGAPDTILPTYQLDPAHPPIPAGGATDAELFWYGYRFLPAAGCYTVTASWPGGGWQAAISAGR